MRNLRAERMFTAFSRWKWLLFFPLLLITISKTSPLLGALTFEGSFVPRLGTGTAEHPSHHLSPFLVLSPDAASSCILFSYLIALSSCLVFGSGFQRGRSSYVSLCIKPPAEGSSAASSLGFPCSSSCQVFQEFALITWADLKQGQSVERLRCVHWEVCPSHRFSLGDCLQRLCVD